MNPLPDLRRGRRRWLAGAALAGTALAAALVGCASLLGPRTIEIPREALQARLAKAFPVTRRAMNLLDIEASAPTLALLPERNRISAGFDLTGRELLSGQAYQGHVAMSFGLRYEPSDLSIRLRDVTVDQINVDGLPPMAERTLTRLGAQIVEAQLQDHIVHQLKPEDLRSADRLGYQVSSIQVNATGLAIHLTPQP